MYIDRCRLIELPKITDPRGNLTPVEAERHIPFKIKRVFFLYDVPTGESRGAHGHKQLHQAMICLSGSFDVIINDGITEKIVHLNRPWQALHIPPLIWAAQANFDPGSVCLVLASEYYDEEDYYREYGDYVAAVERARKSL